MCLGDMKRPCWDLLLRNQDMVKHLGNAKLSKIRGEYLSFPQTSRVTLPKAPTVSQLCGKQIGSFFKYWDLIMRRWVVLWMLYGRG